MHGLHPHTHLLCTNCLCKGFFAASRSDCVGAAQGSGVSGLITASISSRSTEIPVCSSCSHHPTDRTA